MALMNTNDPFFRHMMMPMSMPLSLGQPSTLFGQHFGNGFLQHEMDELRHDLKVMRRENGASQIKVDKDQYQVMLDVKHFKPEEVTVKTVDNCITVEGKHEEKPDEHGYVIRSFKRRYILPDDVKSEHINCHLSADGILKLQAPRAAALEDKTKERAIEILQTGKPLRPALAHNLRSADKKEECCRTKKGDKCCSAGAGNGVCG